MFRGIVVHDTKYTLGLGKLRRDLDQLIKRFLNVLEHRSQQEIAKYHLQLN